MRLSDDQARLRFTAARVARLATVDGAGNPHLVPVTFAVLETDVVFAVDHKPKSRTDLKRLRNIRANPAVSFLVDHYDDDWAGLWWVRADATAGIESPRQAGDAVRALRAKYPQYARHAPQGPVVRATVTSWSGWAAS